MTVKEMVHVRQLTARHVSITTLILALVETLLLMHKRVRVFLVLLANSRMVRQELLQSRVALHKLLIVYERWILLQSFRDLRMTVKEVVHVRQLTASHVSITALVFAAVKALLLMHKRVRIFLVLLANSRMIGQELLQIRVALHKVFVVYERWILLQLLSNLGMAVHKMVHVRQLPARHVSITTLILALVETLLLMHEGIRILAEFFADFRMLLQVLFQLAVLVNKLFVVHQRRIFPHLFGDLWVTVEKAVEAGKLSPRCVIPVG